MATSDANAGHRFWIVRDGVVRTVTGVPYGPEKPDRWQVREIGLYQGEVGVDLFETEHEALYKAVEDELRILGRTEKRLARIQRRLRELGH